MSRALCTARLVLMPLQMEDAAELLAYEWHNRATHAAHGPLRKDADFTSEACAQRIAAQLDEVEHGKACRWTLHTHAQPDTIIGHVAITAIQRGVRHAGVLGYGLDQAHAGQGLMTEAAAAAIRHAFEHLKLHRIEANHRPDNLASARVLAKLGFEREGLARQYIRLNGEWTDVVLNGLRNPAWREPLTLQVMDAPEAYLAPCAIIDFEHPAIAAKAAELRATHTDTLSLARASFEFVRDEIAHSWDVRQGPVTLKASEVLLTGFGYCYAKSHLLAALLRANGIAAGLCYQRLSVGDSGAPYCLHGLNAVLLPEHGWYRCDPRGNKPGVNAVFTPPVEQLAFLIKEATEHDFAQILASPLPEVISTLQAAPDIFWLHAHLPDVSPNSSLA
ncbi:GNAT family N-acetyltransferase [Uliginosibacterium aquaticum]|uniref:GNAT family N-acetyltransferase n=1 Tax=Uliginosibacterium aquaticum TaxID=2731212 RepID=A0ABX2IPM8_9RHOO|nr:GNAT family N-acetyltransferase [Uliginosibacterium aquaticum]NSL56085.1 GNAT family N-acetyltransferase [Uliginosibacterium aquaticum]